MVVDTPLGGKIYEISQHVQIFLLFSVYAQGGMSPGGVSVRVLGWVQIPPWGGKTRDNSQSFRIFLLCSVYLLRGVCPQGGIRTYTPALTTSDRLQTAKEDQIRGRRPSKSR